MNSQVQMLVRPEDVLIGDIIDANGKAARVKMIYSYWDGRWSFIVKCQRGNYAYVYKCLSHQAVTLLSI